LPDASACVAAMAIDPVALGMAEYRDTYEGIGEVGGWVHDLGAAALHPRPDCYRSLDAAQKLMPLSVA
jgi:hypothetical protein